MEVDENIAPRMVSILQVRIFKKNLHDFSHALKNYKTRFIDASFKRFANSNLTHPNEAMCQLVDDYI